MGARVDRLVVKNQSTQGTLTTRQLRVHRSNVFDLMKFIGKYTNIYVQFRKEGAVNNLERNDKTLNKV